MSIFVVNCSDNSNHSFINVTKQKIAELKQKSKPFVASAEEARYKRKNSIVLGNIVKILHISHNTQATVVLIREILSNGANGKYFTAIIHDQLKDEFTKLKPDRGDQVAFFEPFVFMNPAFPKGNSEHKKSPHILEIKSFMIYEKKVMLKSKNKLSEKCKYYNTNPERTQITSTKGDSSPNKSNMHNINTQTRKKPSIQLPVNPQIYGNIKRLSPQYKYTNIKQIKSIIPGHKERANMFVAVQEVTKALTKTTSGKFTIVCKVIDDSISKKDLFVDKSKKQIYFLIHFFTVDDEIIKQIERGDVLRLHRVQVELFNDYVDGRVFNNHDIMVFKGKSSEITPVTVAKKTAFSDDDRKRVNHLKTWFIDINKAVLFQNIQYEGLFNIHCKVIAQPIYEDDKVFLRVSDGSSTSHFHTSFPIKRSHGNCDVINNATVIEISHKQEEFLKLNSGDFVHFDFVNASYTNKSKLSLSNPSLYYYLDKTSNEVHEIKQRLKPNEINCEIITNVLEPSMSHKNVVLDADNDIERSTSPIDNIINTSVCVNEINVDKPDSLNKEDINNGLKPRKALFSANYADLSDAEEDTMEVLDALNKSNGIQQNQSKEDVTPANTSFGDLIELVKTRYCVPRKLSHSEVDLLENSPNKVERGDVLAVKEKRFRKRIANAAGLENVKEHMDDDVTVINLSMQNTVLSTDGVANKKVRVESKSTATECEVNNISCLSELSNKYTSDSVLQWLFHPDDKHTYQIRNLVETFDIKDIFHLLDDEFCKNPLYAQFLNSNINRCQVFLIDVIPKPSLEPLDLVSGFCNSGCRRFFLFSTLIWDFNEESIACCPFCININEQRELRLMFLIELHVMTTFGFHDTVMVFGENAEVFLGCTVEEFVTDPVIRTSRVQMLNEYSMKNTEHTSRTPLMDISVILRCQTLCLVDSKLKLPPNV